MKPVSSLILLFSLLFVVNSVRGNLPGGGTGTGPAVTLVNNGNGTVTMANGIVSIVCTTNSAILGQINYAYNNSGVMVTNQLLAGGKDGGEFYWYTGGFGTGNFNYSVVANNGNYCEMDLVSTSTTNGVMDVHYAMLRGSPGFYVAVIWNHRNGDGAMGMSQAWDNIYLNPEFSWNSVDATRNFQYNIGEAGGGDGTPGAVGVFGAPVEVTLWTNGIAQGRYEDKYKYCANWGTERVWGWSSVSNAAAGVTGQNIGIWTVLASAESYNGGPMKPELMDAPMLNLLYGLHYQMGMDANFGANEPWTMVSGPYFIYCNNVTSALTNAFQTAQALFTDAQAQAAAEQTAWPYNWFTNANYAPASNRGTVTGQFVINDVYNPNATASNLWVGVVQQPITTDDVYDFQEWMKPYQFWVKSDANGNFTIPNVIAGESYTLYAFGSGAAGTFMSQNQTGGNPPLLFNLPAVPFSVTVTGGATNNLGTVTWTPTRVGATVFEIGYPDRTARKFRHGDDYWVGDIGPSPTEPSPIWTKFLEYPFDFPNGPNYTVGQSRWTTDWNFIQPVVTDSQGNYDDSTSIINFNLASAPTNGAQASLYLGLASDEYAAMVVSVNGNNLGSVSGVTGTPNTNIPTSGYYAGYGHSDTSIREGINAVFSDERLTFPASLLNAGTNTITINIRQTGDSYFADHAMYDYLRLEMTGYVPPPPASVTTYAGNNCNLVCWPVVPGATSYNILASTNSGSNYVSITNGVIGPVCGSGYNNATWLDTNAVNGTTYYYVVQSVNPVGASTNSPQSSGVTPSAGLSTSAPAAPTGLSVASAGHQSVALNWTASPGANFYTVYRSTLVDTLGGASNTLCTITLNNNITGTSYTDTSPTDGSIYSYFVTATSAAGTSSNSISVVDVPLPAPPASAPASLTGGFVQATNITLNWSPVSGAVGYIIRRATSANGPFNFVMSITETTYTDIGLSTNNTYYYQVEAVNAGGVSTNALVTVLGPPTGMDLVVIPGNAQVTLSWNAVAAATNYVLQSSITNGGSYTTLLDTTNLSYLNTGLLNGTTYYFVVYSQGPNGQSPLSAQASATPSVAAGGIYWTNTITTSAESWNVNANWINAAAFPDNMQAVAVVNSTIAANQTINLNQAITVGTLNIGAGGGAFTVAANGGSLAFDDMPVAAVLNELPAARGDTISAPMTVNGSLMVSNSSANPLILSGNLAGAANGVSVNGNVTLSGNNTYTGGTVLNSGTLVFETGPAIPTSGALTLNNTGTVMVVSANTLPNVLISGTNAITGNGLSGTGITTLNDAGTLTLFVSGGSDVFDLKGNMTGSGNLVLGSSPMTLRFNGSGGDGNAVFNLGTGANFANVRYTISTAIALGGLTGGAGTQLQGDNTSGAFNMTYTIGGANANTEFDGNIVNGSVGTVALVKTGAGVFTLTGANTYSAGTTISNGTLLVNNTADSATGSGSVIVASGGTLGGTGIIAGPVTVNAGGGFAPGNLLGTLTISNSLTLAADSTMFVQAGHSPLTNNAVNVSGSLTEGGTLNVTNIGAAAFTAGDSFKLFGATNYLGAFTGFSLPPLTAGLVWNTNLLKISGTLAVAAYRPPTIGKLAIAGTNLNVSGSGGISYWTYYVMVSTNLALPAAQWTRLATNQFDVNGNFAPTLTNAISSSQPQKFYQLQLR